MTTTRALVLGGGGLAGIAWETGVLAGLAEEGIDVAATADRVVGTSAGAAVAAQLLSGAAMAELFARQADPALQNEELAPAATSVGELLDLWAKLVAEIPDPVELRRRIGELALGAPTVPEVARRAVIAGRLPRHEWPERHLTLVAVDARTGGTRLFDRHCGVGLVEAVAASCAVPGIWPPVTIGGIRYVDGGIRTSSNADLAAGHDHVLVLAPMADPALEDEVAGLRRTARVAVITPDEAAAETFGTNPLDPAVRTPAAHAGLAQGRREAAAVAEAWA
jgi:NTE family protein